MKKQFTLSLATLMVALLGFSGNGFSQVTSVALGKIVFDSGKSELKQANKSDLITILKSLNKDENNYSSLRIEALAEEDETDATELAEKRANSIKTFLIENKYPAEKITTDFKTIPKSLNNNKKATIFSTY